MEIIQPIKPDEKSEERPLIKEEKKKGLTQEIKELKEFKNKVESGDVKTKNLKIPRKAKVRKRKLKKGWIGIIKIDENRNISGEKQRVSGFAYNLKDGSFHTTDGREILFWEGKFPVIIQPSWRNNPLKITSEDENNETYGDRYKMAKMLEGTIKVKKKGGNIIIWLILGGVVLFGVNYLMGGGLFG
jgi:hypothetical protein